MPQYLRHSPHVPNCWMGIISCPCGQGSCQGEGTWKVGRCIFPSTLQLVPPVCSSTKVHSLQEHRHSAFAPSMSSCPHWHPPVKSEQYHCMWSHVEVIFFVPLASLYSFCTSKFLEYLYNLANIPVPCERVCYNFDWRNAFQNIWKKCSLLC